MQGCGFQAMHPSQSWGYPQNPLMNERERAIQEYVFNFLKQIQDDVQSGTCNINLSKREIQLLNTLTCENAMDLWSLYLANQCDVVEKIQIQERNSREETDKLKRSIDAVQQKQNELKEKGRSTDQKLKMLQQEQNELKEKGRSTDQKLKMAQQKDSKLGKKIDVVSQELDELERVLGSIRQEHVERKKSFEEGEKATNELKKAIQRINEEREKESNRGFFSSLFYGILRFFNWFFGM